MFVDEFSSARVPSAAPSKFYIASSSSAPVGARPRSAMKRVRQLVGDSKKLVVNEDSAWVNRWFNNSHFL